MIHLSSLVESELVKCNIRPAWSNWRSVDGGGSETVRRVRWKRFNGCLRRGEGCVGAVKTLILGGLRQMSVPKGEVIVKGGRVVVWAGGEDMIG